MGKFKVIESSEKWGVLGVGDLFVARRRRTFGLATTVRFYNELVAPGVGGLYFVREIYPSILALAVYESELVPRQSAYNRIRLANTIEALACYLTIQRNADNDLPFWKNFIRGIRKLKRVDEPSYRNLTLNNYVTIPFRVACVRPMFNLGLVRSEGGIRFNKYTLSQDGVTLKNCLLKDNRNILTDIQQWALGGKNTLQEYDAFKMDTEADTYFCEVLRRILFQEGSGNNLPEKIAQRREIDLWFQDISTLGIERATREFDWNKRPTFINANYWTRLREATLFLKMLGFVRNLISQIEQLGKDHLFYSDLEKEPSIVNHSNRLHEAAEEFLKASSNCDESEVKVARKFCTTISENSLKKLIQELCKSDPVSFDVRDDCLICRNYETSTIVDDIVDEEEGSPEGFLCENLPNSLWNFFCLWNDLRNHHNLEQLLGGKGTTENE